MHRSFLAFAILLAQISPALAAETTPAAAAAPIAATPRKVDRDTLVCHTEQVIGSRIPKKLCYTREQEEARTEDARKMTERLQAFGENCRATPGRGC